MPAIEYEGSSGGSSSGAGPVAPGNGSGNGGGSSGPAVLADHPAPIQSYQDGVFGGRGATCGLGDADGPRPFPCSQRHPRAAVRCRGSNVRRSHVVSRRISCGANARASGSRSRRLAALAEVKMLLAYSSGGYALSTDGQKTYTPDFYTSGIGSLQRARFGSTCCRPLRRSAVRSSAVRPAIRRTRTVSPSPISMECSRRLRRPRWGQLLRRDVPNHHRVVHRQGDGRRTPYLSIADKTKGQRAGVAAAGMSTMAMWGLGAALSVSHSSSARSVKERRMYRSQGALGEYFAQQGMGEFFVPSAGMGEYSRRTVSAGFLPSSGMDGLGEYFASNGLGDVGTGRFQPRRNTRTAAA